MFFSFSENNSTGVFVIHTPDNVLQMIGERPIPKSCIDMITIANDLIDENRDIFKLPVGSRIQSNQTEVFNMLWDACTNLTISKFEDRTVTILPYADSKSITIVMLAFNALASASFPDIIPIYISYNDNTMIYVTINHIIEEALSSIGIKVELSDKTCSSIVETLEEHNKHMLLILDNHEEIYRKDRDEHSQVLEIRRQFKTYRDNKLGRVWTVISEQAVLKPLQVSDSYNKKLRMG